MAKKAGKYKITWFAKFIIFCLIVGGLTYGVTNFTNIPQVLKNNNITSFNDLEEKIDEVIEKKKNGKAEHAEPQIQEDTRLEDRLVQLIEENDKLVEKNEKLQNELEEIKKDNVFKIVNQMPRFPGCESEAGGDEEKKKCADSKLLQYLTKNVKYPANAKKNGTEGQAVIQFVVSKSGEIEDVVVLRDPGSGLGDAAKDVVESMNSMDEKWTPGQQDGKVVKVQYTVPLKFKLNF